ncbi:imidazole glycerol phosphate synthase subunit HisH [Hyphobacterium sp. CCMP332]|uniref:imidazole glycerol phosphate synthase subunit HisH n=1 Tax=Hyphobacterium sp. CCMP332 TaxID=2749086 RepID=UPI0016503DD1|nr:imidazole glycerol phosphate synthase subunit HisH [Hyphobacterium sp. CCMP332]QNL18840.1 imidazole glycerol phosphate synthase subunit HisH [Hyphobacterium sp. CCMP332]
MTIAIIQTGCANIYSVQAALDRLGADHLLAATPADADVADRLILPGVGSALPAMTQLRASGWAEALQREARPLLGICLGMQLLFDRSDEGDVDGLGLIPGRVAPLAPFEGGVLPHMGWNTLDVRSPADPLLAGLGENDRAYFVHSFAAPVSEFTIATTIYGANFSAAVRRDNIMGCQFHPERSGPVGARILKNFLEMRS